MDYEDLPEIPSESKTALELLPVDSWCAIFDHLSNTADLVSCTKTCHIWRDILLRGKHATWIQLAEVLPFAIKYLDKESVFACREVCQAFKVIVDCFLDQNYDFQKSLVCRHFSTLTNSGSVVNEDRESYFEIETTTPAIWRTLSMTCRARDRDEWIDFLEQLLQEFGSHVYACHLKILKEPLEMVKILDKFLVYLGNVQLLSIESDQHFYMDDGVTGEVLWDADVDDYLSENDSVFPELPDLVELRLTNFSNFLSSQALNEYREQVERLHICNMDRRLLEDVNLPKLQELRYNSMGTYSHYLKDKHWNVSSLNDILVGTPFDADWLSDWPLTTLVLDFNCLRATSLAFDKLTRILGKFATTLRKLKLALYVEEGCVFFDRTQSDLVLPQLEHFGIFGLKFDIKAFDFLQTFVPNLQQLQLEAFAIWGVQEQKTITFNGDKRSVADIYWSPIWETMGELRKITIVQPTGNNYVFSRSMWMYQQREKQMWQKVEEQKGKIQKKSELETTSHEAKATTLHDEGGSGNEKTFRKRFSRLGSRLLRTLSKPFLRNKFQSK